jgi:hypothetical protein
MLLQAYKRCAMDAFLSFMMSNTTVFNVTVQNWMIALIGFAVIWATVSLLRGL